MPLSAGERIGPYEIVAPAGAGGMGEVYKARDTRLDRIVAIKMSHERFSERFEREARAVAALNHPNICQLHDAGPDYLVMEFVDGSPIAAVDNPRKLLDLAVQLADGLAAAHAASIVHRDLKPDNILVTREGRVKILDFGLAKLAPSADPRRDLTVTSMTDPGTTLGTVAYMSPEQARGDPNLTAQSDQFSLGLVLYELAGGRRAFQRGSAAETMTAIIREEPEALPASVPAPLRWIVERLLAKEPSERYESTRDLYRELKQVRDRLSESTSAARPVAPDATERTRTLAPLVAGVACFIAGAAAALAVLPKGANGPDLARYKFTPISQAETEERAPMWAPDGTSVAYTARIHGIMQVFTRVIGSNAVQLTKAAQDCGIPLWSADGSTIYYISGRKLWAVPASGGTAHVALDGIDAAALHPDGKTVAYERDRKVWIGSLGGAGEAREFWSGPANRGLSFSPDGSHLIVNSIGPLWLFPYPTGAPKTFDTGIVGTAPGWFSDSRHVAVSARNRAGDLSTLSILDVTDGTRQTIAAAPASFSSPSVSPDGRRIAYSSGQFQWDVLEISIRNGATQTVVSGGIYMSPDWAPSGTHFILSVPVGEHAGIEDRQAGSDGFSRRLVDGPGTGEPQWSPDGSRFVFYAEVDAVSSLRLANASGSGAVVLDSTRTGSLRGLSWSPDGQWISYVRSVSGKQELARIRAQPGAAPEVLANDKTETRSPSGTRWSPAGDWIAYPTPAGIGLMSPDGKSAHTLTSRRLDAYTFSKDGSQLYGILHNTAGQNAEPAIAAEWQLLSVNVKSGAETLLAPIDLPASVDRLAGFSIHPDGTRFLVSIGKWPFDIWMIEGFNPPQPKSWLARLLHR